MDLTSHKEHHIIKCLGLVHREEKCGMSPADREEDLMLFIREHLPETAFSPFALDTAPLPLQSAHRRGHTQKANAPSDPPPRFVHHLLSLGSIQALVYMMPCPTTFFSLCCGQPSIFLPQSSSCFCKLLPAPCCPQTQSTQLPSLTLMPADTWLLRHQIMTSKGQCSCAQRRAVPRFVITAATQGGGDIHIS